MTLVKKKIAWGEIADSHNVAEFMGVEGEFVRSQVDGMLGRTSDD
ncbi:hypothetical protein [Janthinobacterium sp. TND4EL3]|nr:hypothetical protein [Janthinobacterium sp. TND4EL3]